MPRKSRRRKHKGGAVNTEIPKPSVSNTSASGAIQGSMNKQQTGNQEVANLNKQFSGGGPVEDIVVPQMGRAGAAGNATITGGIASTLQGGADGEFDNDGKNPAKPDGMDGGRRRRRKTKRKKKKFKKHYMWNTKGKRYLAKTYKQHIKGAKLGHTHKKPRRKRKSKRKTKRKRRR